MFGSVARGEATEGSDVDLVAIYDDLDYGERHGRRCGLEARASAAAGCAVDVMVTDAPEWAVRTAGVPCSVEARVAGDAMELADAGDHARIDWGKEIGLPDTPEAELASRFADMSNAVARLEMHLRPSAAELAAAADGDEEEAGHLEGVRFAVAMSEVLAVVESAAKVTHVVSVGTAPRRTHDVVALLAGQPGRVGDAFGALAGAAVDLGRLHVWRPGFTYAEDRPGLPSEGQLRAHCAAALGIAGFAVGECRGRGVPERELCRWDRRVGRVGEALDGPIRRLGAAESGGPGGIR